MEKVFYFDIYRKIIFRKWLTKEKFSCNIFSRTHDLLCRIVQNNNCEENVIMKKIVALLLALVMVLSLGACSVEKTAETKAPETQPAATEGTQAAAPEAAGDPVEISL